MIFNIRKPKPPLDSFIESIVYFKDFVNEYSVERRLPDGTFTIIIDLTDKPKSVVDNNSLKDKYFLKNGWISGLQHEFITYDAGKVSSMMVIQFKPGCTYPFLNIPNNIFLNKVVELEDLWGNDLLMLRERLINSQNVEVCFDLVENFLISRSNKKFELNPYISYFIESIHKSPHMVTLSELFNKIGFSKKHFIELFKKNVGTTPKYFSRIIKFQQVISLLEMNHKINWTELALQTGYYDQAHFINEFKIFSGIQPTMYENAKGEHVNYLPIK